MSDPDPQIARAHYGFRGQDGRYLNHPDKRVNGLYVGSLDDAWRLTLEEVSERHTGVLATFTIVDLDMERSTMVRACETLDSETLGWLQGNPRLVHELRAALLRIGRIFTNEAEGWLPPQRVVQLCEQAAHALEVTKRGL